MECVDAVLLHELGYASRPRVVGGDLCPEVPHLHLRGPDVAPDKRLYVPVYDAALHQLDRRYYEALLVELCAVGREAAWRLPSNVGVVGLVGGVGDDLAVVEHGRYDREVGEVGAAYVRVVEEQHVAWLKLAPVGLEAHPDGQGHAAEMHGYVLGLGDELPPVVEQGAAVVHPLLDVGAVSRLLEGYTHLLGRVDEGPLDDLDGCDVHSQLVSLLRIRLP